MALTFSTKQLHAIQLGALKRQRLIAVATKAATPSAISRYPHTYIYGPPGLGKTFTVDQAIEKTNIPFYKVVGATSLFAFGVELAVFNYLDKVSSKIIISVDDCDAILDSPKECDVIKNVLSGMRAFKHTKNMSAQMSSFTSIQKEAIEAHSTDDHMGYEVPCDRFVFVFTSNFKLPTDDDVLNARARGGSGIKKIAGQNAIRSRCQTNDFDMDWEEQWGWISDVILNTQCLDVYNVTNEDRIIILDWLYNNWKNLKERSIRTAEKMAELMVQYPDNYKDAWITDYIK